MTRCCRDCPNWCYFWGCSSLQFCWRASLTVGRGSTDASITAVRGVRKSENARSPLGETPPTDVLPLGINGTVSATAVSRRTEPVLRRIHEARDAPAAIVVRTFRVGTCARPLRDCRGVQSVEPHVSHGEPALHVGLNTVASCAARRQSTLDQRAYDRAPRPWYDVTQGSGGGSGGADGGAGGANCHKWQKDVRKNCAAMCKSNPGFMQ